MENKTIEIKGYKTDEWAAKLQYNPDVITLYEDEMKPYLEYARNKYGRDYIKIYEENNLQS